MLSFIYYFKISNLSLKPNTRLKILNINVKENEVVEENQNLFSCLVIDENKILNILSPLEVKIKKINFKEQDIIFDDAKIFLEAEPIKENLLNKEQEKDNQEVFTKENTLKVEENIDNIVFDKEKIKDKEHFNTQNSNKSNVLETKDNTKMLNIKENDSKDILEKSSNNNSIENKNNIEKEDNINNTIEVQENNNSVEKEENINNTNEVQDYKETFENDKSKNLHSQLNVLNTLKDIEVTNDSCNKKNFFCNGSNFNHNIWKQDKKINVLENFKGCKDQDLEKLKNKSVLDKINDKNEEILQEEKENINKNIIVEENIENTLENESKEDKTKKTFEIKEDNIALKENDFETKSKKDTIKNLNNKLNKSNNIKDKIFSKLYQNINNSKVVDEIKPLTPEEIEEAKKNSITQKKDLSKTKESNLEEEVNKNFFTHLDKVNNKYLNNTSLLKNEEEKKDIIFEKLNKYSGYNLENNNVLNKEEKTPVIENKENIIKKDIQENIQHQKQENVNLKERKEQEDYIEKTKEVEQTNFVNNLQEQMKKENQEQIYKNISSQEEKLLKNNELENTNFVNNLKAQHLKENQNCIYKNISSENSNSIYQNNLNKINQNSPTIFNDFVQKNLKNWLFKKDGSYIVTQTTKSYIFSIELSALKNFLKNSQITFYDYVIFVCSFLLKKFNSLNFVNKEHIEKNKNLSYSIDDVNVQNINLVNYNDCKKSNYIISGCEEINSFKNLHEKLYFYNKGLNMSLTTFQITSLLKFSNWTSIINKIISTKNTNLLIYRDVLDKHNKIYTFNLLYDLIDTEVNENEVILFMNYLKYYILDPKKFFKKLFL